MNSEQLDLTITENQWRRLALQFDGHRMQAIGHLKAMLADPVAHAETVRAFLAAPPLSGDKELARRIADYAAQAQQTSQMPSNQACYDLFRKHVDRYGNCNVPEFCKELLATHGAFADSSLDNASKR